MVSEELQSRIKTAGIAGAAALLLLLWSNTSFLLLLFCAAIILAMEWQKLAEKIENMHPMYGLAYIAIPCLCLMTLREHSVMATLHLLLIVWATDIAAYFAGKTFGGPKLIPSISPKKTWAGLIGGMVAAAAVAATISSFSATGFSFLTWLILGALLAVVAQAGDFFASWLKRKADVKDSGKLLPGHGGLLDRVDGLLFAAPIYLLLFGIGHA